MPRVADHVHDWNPGFVDPVDDLFRGNANGTDEQSNLLLDYDVDEFR
jgi:hypothetical protein